MDDTLCLAGYLEKKRGGHKRDSAGMRLRTAWNDLTCAWNSRFFRLYGGEHAHLDYYRDDSEASLGGAPRGSFDCRGRRVIQGLEPNTFVVLLPGRDLTLRADSDAAACEWVSAISCAGGISNDFERSHALRRTAQVDVAAVEQGTVTLREAATAEERVACAERQAFEARQQLDVVRRQAASWAQHRMGSPHRPGLIIVISALLMAAGIALASMVDIACGWWWWCALGALLFASACTLCASAARFLNTRSRLRAINALCEPLQDANDTSAPIASGVDDADLCVICFNQPRTHTVLPCGHYCLCNTDAQTLLRQGYRCPVCRGPIASVQRIYM